MLRRLTNLALCMASVFVAIGGVEMALRYTAYGKQFKQYKAESHPRFYHRPDSINGHDITPNFPPTEWNHGDYLEAFGSPFTISSNEIGCRDKIMNPGRYILLLGDSFTWAFVPLEHTFGTLVEQLIGVRVLKCGVSGYGTRHERHKLELVVKQVGAPSVVIVGYYVGNDLENDYLYPQLTVLDGYLVKKVAFRDVHKAGQLQIYTDDQLMEQIRKHLQEEPTTVGQKIKNYMATHSIVYSVLRNAIGLRQVAFRLGLAEPPHSSVVEHRAYSIFYSASVLQGIHLPADEYRWLRDAWPIHLNNLDQLARAAAEHRARLLVVIIPTAEQVYGYLRPTGKGLDWEYPNTRLTEYFEKKEISFLDLLPELRRYANLQPKPVLDPEEDFYWHHDRHLNVRGNRLVGFLISRYLLEQSFLELDNKSERLSDVTHLLSASFAGVSVK